MAFFVKNALSIQDQALAWLSKQSERLDPQMQAADKQLSELKVKSAGLCQYVTPAEKVLPLPLPDCRSAQIQCWLFDTAIDLVLRIFFIDSHRNGMPSGACMGLHLVTRHTKAVMVHKRCCDCFHVSPATHDFQP